MATYKKQKNEGGIMQNEIIEKLTQMQETNNKILKEVELIKSELKIINMQTKKNLEEQVKSKEELSKIKRSLEANLDDIEYLLKNT